MLALATTDAPPYTLDADEEEERREWERKQERLRREQERTQAELQRLFPGRDPNQGYTTAAELAALALAEIGIVPEAPRKPKAEPAELLYALGLKQIRQRGSELSACCPFHDDRVPSFSMNAETGQWLCHAGCGSGNATTLLARKLDIPTGQAHARLMEGNPLYPVAHKSVHRRAPYVRKTTNRCSGSKADIEKQLEQALRLVESRGSMSWADKARALVRDFGISRSTAYLRLQVAGGKTQVRVKNGVRLRVRIFHCLKRIRARLLGRASAGTRSAGAGVLQNENFGRSRWVTPRKGRCGRSRPRGPTVLMPSPSGARGIRAQVHPLFNPAW
jgi:CHC2 zinc finger